MIQKEIGTNEAGQRLDKFLQKFMPLANTSFYYKMLRKKNITLNGKKAEGKEKLLSGDVVSFFLSEETIKSFQGSGIERTEYDRAYRKLEDIQIIYEDEHIILMNKPKNILSQKAKEDDCSLNEWLIGYLLENGLNQDSLNTFKPSICNRLDRNTQGLVVGAKSLAGSQEMNRLIRTREIQKYYRLFVKGTISKEEVLEGYLLKDEKNNKVRLVKQASEETSFIKTRYYPIKTYKDKTLVEVELITGKSHQIRIHMASIGHPLLGDYKYGDKKWNDQYKEKFQISSQQLYACRLQFPQMEGVLCYLSGKCFEAPVPESFQLLMKTD